MRGFSHGPAGATVQRPGSIRRAIEAAAAPARPEQGRPVKILVTGAAGFIGSNYVRRQLADAYPETLGAEVTVLDKLTYAGTLTNLAEVADSPRYRFVEGDICDVDLVNDLMPGHDAVVHFAAESHVDRSITGASDFVVTNVLGTQTLLQAALNAGVEPVRARQHRRGLRLDPGGLVGRDPSAGAELPLQRLQGRLGPPGPCVRPHLRHGGLHHPLLEQLRAPPVPGEGHPAVRDQPDGRPAGAALRRGTQRPRLAARRRPLSRASTSCWPRAERARRTTSAAAPS